MSRLRLSLFLALILPTLAWAAPSITGISVNGDLATINGTGFGTGPTVLVFDRFNDETPGATMNNTASEYGSWTYQVRSPRAVTKLPRFTGDVAWDAHGTDIDDPRRFGVSFPSGIREVFLSYDTTLAGGSYAGNGSFPSSGGSCWKFTWLLGNGNTDGDVCVPTDKDGGTYFWVEGNEGCKTGVRYFTKVPRFEVGNVWNSWSFWLKSAPTATSGDLNYESVNASDGAVSQLEHPIIFDADGRQDWSEWNLPGWISGGTSVTVFHDNVYIAIGANSQAHVEIRNSSTWTSATKRVVCYPVSWSNTQIVAKIYQDDLGSKATLFVIDSAGDRAGGSISFESSGDTTNPSISITSPTSSSTYNVGTASSSTVGGSASDNTSVSYVTWANSLTGGSGTATGTTSWSASVALNVGVNPITVTAWDGYGNSSTDTITITREPETDTDPPVASSFSPESSATGVDVTTDISVVVSDTGFGVDSSTITLLVNGSSVTPTITGSTGSYTVSYNPPTDFDYGVQVSVSLDASDLNSNAMTTETWYFTTVEATVPGTSYGRNTTDAGIMGSADTYLNAGGGGDDNFSTESWVNTYIYPINTCANTILRYYDLDSLSGLTIVQARLYMVVDDAEGDDLLAVSAHQVTGVTPVITSATWLTYDGTNNWPAGGGLASIAAAEDTENVGLTGEWSWDVTDMVTSAVAGTGDLFILLQAASGSSNSFRYFHSDEGTDGLRPRLVIQTEAGTTPPPPGMAGTVIVEDGMPLVTAPDGLTVIVE